MIPPDKINLRQERDLSEVFETAFAVLRSQPGTFFKGMLVYVGPFIALSYALGLVIFGYGLIGSFEEGIAGLGGSAVLNLLGTVALVNYVAMFLAEYERSPQGVVQLRKLWRPFRVQFMGYLWLCVLFFGLCFVGLFFLVLGAAFLAAAMSSGPMAYAVEKGTAGRAFVRSFSLSGSDYWTNFGLTLFLAIIWFIWAWAFSAGVFTGLEYLVGIFTDDLSRDGQILLQLITSLLTNLYSTTWLSICLLVFGVQYFNLVERAEFVDLSRRISTVGSHLRTKPTEAPKSKLII